MDESQFANTAIWPQVWRPLKPVVSSPLGFVPANFVAKEDLINYKLHFPGRTGYNYAVQYNPNHR